MHLGFLRVYVVLAVTLLSALSLFPAQAYAQSLVDIDKNRPGATLEFSPPYPKPGDVVTVKLKQFMFNPNFSLVTWRLNGQIVLKGYGENVYRFKAGPVGSLVILDVFIEEREGGTASAKKTLRVSDIAFVWEARTYTPPFFQGRPRFSYGASVAVVAYPTVFNMDGTLYDSSELLFTWMQGVKKITSGLGMTSIVTAPQTPFDALVLTVQVTDPEGELRAVQNITIPPSAPRLLLYEDDPLLGVLYRSAIPDSYALTKEELKLVAEPVYGTTQTRTDPSLTYAWNVNNTSYNFPGSIVLRPEGTISGVTDIILTMINSKNFLHRLQRRISVAFSAPGETETLWTESATDAL